MQINEYQKLAMQTLNPELEKKDFLFIKDLIIIR